MIMVKKRFGNIQSLDNEEALKLLQIKNKRRNLFSFNNSNSCLLYESQCNDYL